MKRQTYLSARAWTAASKSAVAWVRAKKAELDDRAVELDRKQPVPAAYQVAFVVVILSLMVTALIFAFA